MSIVVRGVSKTFGDFAALDDVSLKVPDGESINVEMPHDRFRSTPIAVGDRVFVSPRDAKVFVEDYSI